MRLTTSYVCPVKHQLFDKTVQERQMQDLSLIITSIDCVYLITFSSTKLPQSKNVYIEQSLVQTA